MKKMKNGSPWRSPSTWIFGTVGALACLLLVATASMASSNNTFGSDAWITAKTKIALITNEDVSAMNVNVDTIDGMVTLHGTVSSDLAKEKASEVAKTIDGVREVRNLLQVVKKSAREETEEKDETIAENVEKALDDDTALNDSDISVQSVNDGVVLLGGHASSLGDHLEALQIAEGVPGVRRVASEVTSDNRLYDEGIWKKGAQVAGDAPDAIQAAGEKTADTARSVGEKTADAARNAGATTKNAAEAAGSQIADAAKAVGNAASKAASATGTVVQDAWITSATKTKLIADDAVSAMNVNVDTRDGVVTLFGIVDTAAAKAAAEKDARSVSGVRDVKNEIEIAMNEKPDMK